MKILFGSIVVDARGRLNGHVFKKTATGHAITKLALPRNRDKWMQNRRLSAMAKVLAHWKTLNPRERANWAAFADKNPLPNKFGVPVNIGARAMYQRVAFGYSFPVSVYPLGDRISSLIPTTQINALGISDDNGRLSFDVTEFTDVFILNIWVQQTSNTTTSPPQNGWRRLPNLIVTSAGVVTSNVNAKVILLFDLNSRSNWVKYQVCNEYGFGLYNHIQRLTVD